MAKVKLKKTNFGDNIQIDFRYVYKPQGANPDTDPEKYVTGAFFARKDATKAEIKKQLKGIIKELLERAKATETEEEMEIDLGED